MLDPAGFNAGGITAIANGGTGATTAALALAALLPSQAGNAGKALVTSGSAASWAAFNTITSGTAVASTSGTSIDFISIPAGVKRVTVMFNGVSTNGTSVPLIQLGAGSNQATGYLGAGLSAASSGLPAIVNYTTGFGMAADGRAVDVRHGLFTIALVGSNTWVGSGYFAQSDTTRIQSTGGSVTLSGTLDRVRITTVNGTDTFDAGSINIFYES